MHDCNCGARVSIWRHGYGFYEAGWVVLVKPGLDDERKKWPQIEGSAHARNTINDPRRKSLNWNRDKYKDCKKIIRLF